MSSEPRTRSRGGFNTPAYVYWNGLDTVNGYGGGFALDIGDQQVMSDFITPGFRSKQKRGEVVFNDMTSSRNICTYTGSGYTVRPNYDPSALRDTWITDENFVSNFFRDSSLYSNASTVLLDLVSEAQLADARVEAATQCLSARGVDSNSDLWETLGEYHQTLELIRNPLSIYRNWQISRFKRGDGWSTARSAADLWVQLRYGLLPLVRDVQGIIDGLSKQIGVKRLTSRGSVKIHEHYSTDDTRVWNQNQMRMTTSIDLTYKANVRATSLDEVMLTTANNVGFSSKRLLTVPWQLLNKSFVVDWFVNLGAFLEAVAPVFGCKQLGACLVVKKEMILSLNLTNFEWLSTAHTPVSAPTGSFTQTLTSTVRSPLPSPGIVIKNDFRMAKPTRALDALALAYQAFDSLMQAQDARDRASKPRRPSAKLRPSRYYGAKPLL